VDNPAVFLNQEANKEFLQSKTQHNMYCFFRKATQMDLMNSEYQEAKEHNNTGTYKLQRKRELLLIAERDVKQWEQKYST